MELGNELDKKKMDEKNLQEIFYKFRMGYQAYCKRYDLDDKSYNEVSDLQDKLFRDMAKTKYTNLYKRWTKEDDVCLLHLWSSGVPMLKIESILGRSESSCGSRLSRLRCDELVESIPHFFDELSAELNLDSRRLTNAANRILDGRKYSQLRMKVIDDVVNEIKEVKEH